MAEKYIVTYTDNRYGLKKENLTKEFPFDKDASATIEHDTKQTIWAWKKDHGMQITDFKRYYSVLDVTEREDMGGEL